MSFGILSEKEVATLLSHLEEHEHYVFLDTAKPDSENDTSLLFTNPKTHIRYRSGEDLSLFFDQLHHWLDHGFHLAGWFAYEFLQEPGPGRNKLLAELGVYPEPDRFARDSQPRNWATRERRATGDGNYRIDNLRPNMEREEYCRAIRTILDYIGAGDTYQVNYTFKLFFDFQGSVAALYRDLRHSQPVPYGCCIKNGNSYVLSFSPELFFRVDEQRLSARPMKGTLQRGRTPEEDLSNATFLYGDIKNRSENVMIVDLLRNDLSRLVAATGGGTVSVESLFDVEQYQSVLQMTSTVVARRFEQRGLTPREIVEALFPCGSVTGAPKIRTMEIIDELEKVERGIYTGAIGYFAPDRTAVFNVPIRTVLLNGGHGEMGIGSGIVSDSSPESEWQECLLKSRFLTDPLPRFALIETMYYDMATGFLLLEEHLERLAASAGYFAFDCDLGKVRNALQQESAKLPDDGAGSRVRLTMTRDGELEISSSGCEKPGRLQLPATGEDPGPAPVAAAFSDVLLDRSGPWLFHKTTMRQAYDKAWERGRADTLFDVLFCNEAGEVTEGCISNIFVLLGGTYYTPPLHCGLLGGVMRRHILENRSNPPVQERTLSRLDLERAEAIYLVNSVRGVVRAELREPVSGERFGQ